MFAKKTTSKQPPCGGRPREIEESSRVHGFVIARQGCNGEVVKRCNFWLTNCTREHTGPVRGGGVAWLAVGGDPLGRPYGRDKAGVGAATMARAQGGAGR